MPDPALIFFFLLASFLCFRLYMVLGTKGGHEPEEQDNFSPKGFGAPETSEDVAPPTPIVPAEPLPAWVETVREHYGDFDGEKFIEGAKYAYEMIVTAFAKGNLGDVKAYVDKPVYEAFSSAVSTYTGAGKSMEVTFVGIEKADVLSATVLDKKIQVVVAFQSDQIRVLRDNENTIIDGDPARIDLVKDVWTFSRPIGSGDPNWLLSATDGAA